MMKTNKWILALVMIVGLGTAYAAVNGVFANVTFSGVLSGPAATITTVTGALHGNATTATALAGSPVGCTGGQVATGIAANGNANCASVQGPITSTCNGNGCYIQYPDGTIDQWGTVIMPTAGGTVQTTTITFATPFASSVASLTVAGNSDPDGSNDDTYTVYTRNGTLSNSIVVARCADNIGGSGCSNLSNAIPISWRAIGK